MSTTRITQGTLSQRTFDNLQNALGKLGKLQEQLASGKSINRPSDSPTGTVSALRLRASVDRTAQYGRNIEDGFRWLGIADNAMQSMNDALLRAREITVRGMNASSGQVERGAVAAEIRTIRDGLIELANTQYLDRPIFAGTSGASSAYDASGTFIGDTGSVDRNVAPGVTVSVNVSAPEAFGTGVSSLFTILENMAIHLEGSGAGLDADLDALDAATVQLQQVHADVGARYRRLEVLKDQVTKNEIDLKSSLSAAEDIDIAKTILDMQLQENAYQAALGATARVIQPSLMDFLR